MSMDESSKQTNVSKWRQRLQNEADHGPKVFIDVPLDTDVLLGKHRDAFNHVGNRSFRTLIQDHWERYNNAAGRCERTAIVVQIVDFLREQRQVRFLKRDNAVGGWYIVHDSVAREKVGHAIRDAINFRRHHLRKMSAEIRREHTAYGGYSATSSSSDSSRSQSSQPALDRPVDDSSRVRLSDKASPLRTKKGRIRKRGQKRELPLTRNLRGIPPSKHDIVGTLGGLKENDESNTFRVPIRDSYESNDYASHCSSYPPSLNLSPSTEPSIVQDEAAMLGAFDVWASQTFSEA